jgi:hypothetical protein
MSELDVDCGVTDEAVDILFSLVFGANVISTSSHQSNSCTFLTPLLSNHFFRPSPTKNCAFGWCLCNSRMVGCER